MKIRDRHMLGEDWNFLFVTVRFVGFDDHDATDSNKTGKGRTTVATRDGVKILQLK
jgi:hypothetical protein